MATYNPLSTNFKDDILADSNDKRKYKQINNSDGTISLQDSTAYKQVGSQFGAKEIIEEREAINEIYANKLVTLDEIDLVTEEGYYVDALAVKELKNNILKTLMPYKVGYKVLAIPSANTTAIKVLSISEINKLFGVTDASRGNTMAMFANGNGDNQTVHVTGATFKDDYWHAVMDSGALKQDIQINYVVWYFGNQTPTSSNAGTAKMQKKTATPTQTTQVVTPDTGYDGLSSVTVSAIPYEESDGESGGTTVNIG